MTGRRCCPLVLRRTGRHAGRVWPCINRRGRLLGEEETGPLGNEGPLAGDLLRLSPHCVGLLPGPLNRAARAKVDVTAAALEIVQHRSGSQLVEGRVSLLEHSDRDADGLGAVVGRRLDSDAGDEVGVTDRVEEEVDAVSVERPDRGDVGWGSLCFREG